MTMDPRRALRIAGFLLVADGLAALYLGRLLGPVGLAVAVLAVAGAWRPDDLRARLGARSRWRAVTVAVAAAALAVDLAWVTSTMLDVFTHLLVALLVARLYAPPSLRQARDVAFLSFFMLVAVAPVVLSVAFLGLFLVLVVAGTWMLLLRHVLAEAELMATPPPRGTLGLGRGLAPLGGAAIVATLLTVATLFLIIPRIGQAALPLGLRSGRMVAGFSERVALGAFGEIEADASVVMRVRLPLWPEPVSPAGLPLRWRGVAFDRFDGREWSVGEPQRVTFRRHRPAPFPVQRYRGRGVLTQEVFLEPIGSDMVFGAPRVVSFSGPTEYFTLDDLGNMSVPTAAARLRYTVDSELEASDPRTEALPDGRTPPDPAWRARYTQLPPVPARVRELARRVTADADGPYAAARRLTAYLAREYRYTRVLERTTDLDPIEEFLFVRRSGNCEYFAAALAVMLRSIDIPARVVNGFQRGEWNPYGRYFMVRLRDAHSWVEVFVDGSGWATLDPSPRGDADAAGAPAPAALWLDALRMRWYRYVVNWSLGDQLAAALAVRRTASSWSAWSLSLPASDGVPRLVLVVAAAGALAIVVVRWRRRGTAAGSAEAVPPFYRHALRVLARRGLVPAAGETAREFAARATAVAPAWAAPLARLTAGYERVRFGGVTLGGAEAAALAADVVAVRRVRPGRVAR